MAKHACFSHLSSFFSFCLFLFFLFHVIPLSQDCPFFVFKKPDFVLKKNSISKLNFQILFISNHRPSIKLDCVHLDRIFSLFLPNTIHNLYSTKIKESSSSLIYFGCRFLEKYCGWRL